MALDTSSPDQMSSVLARQKAAHIRDGIPSAERREEWLDKAIDLLVTHRKALSEAIEDAKAAKKN